MFTLRYKFVIISKEGLIEVKKKNIVRTLLIIFIVINCIGLGYYVYKSFFNQNNEPTNISEVVKKIDNYTLYTNTNKLYKETFEELNDKSDVTKYTNAIAKLFVIDFYSLKFKITNTDVGGLQFINEDIKDNFKEKAINTIYKYVKNNVYNDREQELPDVKSIEVVSNELVDYTYNNELKEAYKISLNWTYQEDLGYETSKTLYLIKQNNEYSIIEMS